MNESNLVSGVEGMGAEAEEEEGGERGEVRAEGE